MIVKIANHRFTLKSVSLLLFFIYPILSVPFFIIGILNKEKWAFVLCAIFMGLLSILYPPAGDLYRYAEDFNLYKECNLDTFFILLVLKFDYFLPFLSFVIGNLGGTPELTRFIFAFLSYYLLFDLFLLIVKNNTDLSDKKLYIYSLIILVPLTFWTFLFRFNFALAFLLNGTYRWFILNQKKGIFLILFSSLIHISYIIFIPICLIGKNKMFRFNYLYIIVLYLLPIILDFTYVGTKILSLLPFSDSLVTHIYEYIDGSQSESITNQYSLRQIIMMYISNCISIYIFYIYIKLYRTCYNINMNIVNYLLIVLLITSSFPIMNGRFLAITSFFINVNILISYNTKLVPQLNKHLKYIYYATIFMLLTSIWEGRFFLTYSYENKIFTSSFIDIISFSYSEDWVNNNIDEEGNFYKWYDNIK